jgi:hypothetical protein
MCHILSALRRYAPSFPAFDITIFSKSAGQFIPPLFRNAQAHMMEKIWIDFAENDKYTSNYLKKSEK